MKKAPNAWHDESKEEGPSRRDLLQRAAVSLGSLFVILGVSSPAVAKMAQKAAAYQETPKGEQKCANCALFKVPASCTLVDGAISPDGWCRFYAKKS